MRKLPVTQKCIERGKTSTATLNYSTADEESYTAMWFWATTDSHNSGHVRGWGCYETRKQIKARYAFPVRFDLLRWASVFRGIINYVLNFRYWLLINIKSLIISNLTLWTRILTSQRRYSDQELTLTPKHGKRTQNTRLTESGHSSISSDVAIRVAPFCPYVTSESVWTFSRKIDTMLMHTFVQFSIL